MSIKIKNLCKTFKLYDSPVKRLLEAFHPLGRKYHQTVTALHDISLEIPKGETLGIIGCNGSGKSTLLQLVCQIMSPTSGTIECSGRISALLELGAGFNPEFSGRENVFLSGAIQGLSREEMEECYEDIVAFADIGDFINHPVKTYSSGMYVRLAFAVAINVNPDILIVDEALSVGDTAFQAKCFARFKEFQEQGVTILFVTHAMDLITRYCQRAVLLDKGHLVEYGNPKLVVDRYNRILAAPKVEKTSLSSSENAQTSENRYGDGRAEIFSVGIRDVNGVEVKTLLRGEEYFFWMKVRFHANLDNPVYAFTIKDVKGFDITGTNTLFQDVKTDNVVEGDEKEAVFKLVMRLNGGGYLLSFGCAGFEDGEYVVYERRFDALSFEVVSDRGSMGFFDPDAEISVVSSPAIGERG